MPCTEPSIIKAISPCNLRIDTSMELCDHNTILKQSGIIIMITSAHEGYSVSATDSAIKAMHQAVSSRGKGLGIRLGVRTTGCSGYAYVIEFVDKLNSEDIELSLDEKVSVFSDAKSMMLLNGITIDFIKKGLQQGFEFINPNAKGECGCGESFSV